MIAPREPNPIRRAARPDGAPPRRAPHVWADMAAAAADAMAGPHDAVSMIDAQTRIAQAADALRRRS